MHKKNALAVYLEEEGLVQKVFAQKVGVSQTTLTLILRGERMPSLEVAFQIEKVTKGKVKASDWLKQAKK